ncbi:hypothetical protein RFI_20963 [Reticulomyxa filosa]|uniref:Uncharacterized protein n=1 Tax=Reticulomyxa filosa TaxID=46433 RepID=X6MRH2_RETFI|nr:hypothetical protein RFI_20963 [Reticulomyxa filosa]|eukprot:ETO16384.1 hypothetical protein RFI_20963 [Reticulomyxa filosa]
MQKDTSQTNNSLLIAQPLILGLINLWNLSLKRALSLLGLTKVQNNRENHSVLTIKPCVSSVSQGFTTYLSSFSNWFSKNEKEKSDEADVIVLPLWYQLSLSKTNNRFELQIQGQNKAYFEDSSPLVVKGKTKKPIPVFKRIKVDIKVQINQSHQAVDISLFVNDERFFHQCKVKTLKKKKKKRFVVAVVVKTIGNVLRELK